MNSLILLVTMWLKKLIDSVYSAVFKNEIRMQNKWTELDYQKRRELERHNEDLLAKNFRLTEAFLEINELISKGYSLLGFHQIKTKNNYNNIELPFYFVYRNEEKEKFFEFPKSHIEALCKSDPLFELLFKGAEEKFVIRGHLPGQFKEYRKRRSILVKEPEKNRGCHIVYLEGKFFLDSKINKRKIHLTNIYTDEYTEMGLASLAISYLVSLAKETEVEVIFGEITYYSDPEIREKLRRFYSKNGFTVTNNENKPTSLDKFRMEIPLKEVN